MSDKNEKMIVMKGYLRAFVFCLILGSFALYVAECVNHHFYISHLILQLLRLASVIPAAAGVYGMRGWEIQTWDGNTRHERLNKRISQILMGIGFVATVFTFGLEEG